VAEPSSECLSQIVSGFRPPLVDGVTLELKDFFSAAALYANGKNCGSLSLPGFSVKLRAETRQRLIDEGGGREFRFFAKGPIKHEYVALLRSIVQDNETLGRLLHLSVSYVVGAPSSNAPAKT